MSKNIFKAREEFTENVKRSSFDLSHRNNFTTKIGQITPILCQECVPGDSFQIKTDLGLRLSPMVFPIQTPLVATVQYFKVPHRILWKNFEDFIGDTKENLVHPYISRDYMWHPTSSLADYLGVPSTYASPDRILTTKIPLFGLSSYTREFASSLQATGSVTETQEDFDGGASITGTHSFQIDPLTPVSIEHFTIPYPLFYENNSGTLQLLAPTTDLYNYLAFSRSTNADGYCYISAQIPVLETSDLVFTNATNQNNISVCFIYADSVFNEHIFSSLENWKCGVSFNFSYSSNDTWVCNDPDNFLFYNQKYINEHSNVRLLVYSRSQSVISNDGVENFGLNVGVTYRSASISDVVDDDSPFVTNRDTGFPAVRINALPFRAYESIYNCYFRTNTDVDPFIKDGQPEYNKWITNDNDGADSTTPLDLRFRNFELDFLTSAKNSPQQGEAPLVGVSSTGTFTFEDENGIQYTAKAIIDENDRLTGIDTYDPELPKASLHRLMDTITHGISINDLRNVSAFQKWKDQNLRRGYRYKDQVMSHFGVDAKSVHYDDPQFIGGMTQNVNVQAISSTTSTSEISLGDFGGQATLFKSSDHTITTYCDEHCFIIGLLTIVPIPVYSQTLDPMFIKDNMLSYHFPEFNHISMQPIPMKYVTPIESYLLQKDTGDNELDKVFGYQRPQWEMVAKIDTSHSHMRTDMSNYLMTRYFQTPPELGHDFLVINPEHLTSPFVDTDVTADNIVGQVYFDISAQRPVSRMAIPRIEA